MQTEASAGASVNISIMVIFLACFLVSASSVDMFPIRAAATEQDMKHFLPHTFALRAYPEIQISLLPADASGPTVPLLFLCMNCKNDFESATGWTSVDEKASWNE